GPARHERAAGRVAAHVVARHVRADRPRLSGEAWIAGALPHLPQPHPPIPDAEDEPVRRGQATFLCRSLSRCLKAGLAGVTMWKREGRNSGAPSRFGGSWLMSR